MLQMKLKQLQSKQKGFTLLELLVVITLLAVLSVGALVAYEGIGDTAAATAASSNTAAADRAIRNYRAITQNYPDQWDNLVTTAGLTPAFLQATKTQAAFARLSVPTTTSVFRTAFNSAFSNVGITTLQVRLLAPTTALVEPNLQHNEGATTVGGVAAVSDTLISAAANFSILPSFGTVLCSVNGVAMGTKLNGLAMTAADGLRQNVINDSLGSTQCNLVLAVGFGHDAAHSTAASTVAISTAPTFVSKLINPAVSYARYIALFHAGSDNVTVDNNITAGEIFKKARLLAVVDTEGHAIDTNIAKQNPTN